MTPSQQRYLKGSVRSLPVLGGWFGQGYNANMGTILKANPQLIVFWYPYMGPQANVVAKLHALGIPILNVRLRGLSDFVDAYRILGAAFHQQVRAQRLIQYISEKTKVLAKLRASIPADQRVTVYYAGSPDGLQSGCDNAMPTATIQLAGGENVFHCTVNHFQGYQHVSMGQVLQWNPQVIISDNPQFMAQIYQNPAWQPLRAVQAHRVYFIPQQPFNWFNRLYSFMQILGAQWLANKLYPQKYPFDEQNIQKFYRLFLWVDLSHAQVQEILHP